MTPAQLLALIVLVDSDRRASAAAARCDFRFVDAMEAAQDRALNIIGFDPSNTDAIGYLNGLLDRAERMRAEEVERSNG